MQTPLVKASLAALVVLFLATNAHADNYPSCDRTPTGADIDAAKGMHKAAENYYAKALYEKAIASWKEAYTFDCTAHRLLINIGNAYEKLGKTQEAIEAFEAYIERMGSNADTTIVDKVTNLRQLLVNQPPDPQPDPDPVPDPVPDPAPQPDPNGDDGGPGVAPWVMVGAGAAVAVVGGVMLGIGIKKESDAEAACPDRGNGEPCPPDVADDGNLGIKMQIAGGVLLGVGVAAAAGGIVWWAVASIPEENAAAGWNVGPLVDVKPTAVALPGYGAFGLTGSF